jgi:hypothetical protein
LGEIHDGVENARTHEGFTYAEVCWWFLECIMINPFRWKWVPFVMFGWGGLNPMRIVGKEKGLESGRVEATW